MATTTIISTTVVACQATFADDSMCAGMLLISEWWASEIMTILGGLLPDAERQLSAIAIYTTTNAMCFMLSLGLAAAVSTR